MIVCSTPFSPHPVFLFEKQNYAKYRKPGLYPKKVPAFLRRWRPKTRPRASATAVGAAWLPEVRCIRSAATERAGLRRRRVPMPTTCTSTAAGSFRRTAVAVHTVFSCVASRDRGRAAPPGFRDAMSTRGFGGLRDVGSTGYSWSSSIAGTDAHGLGFGYNGVNPQYYSNRANGLQLRCLQEHPKGVLLAIRPRKAQPSCAERHPSGTLTDEKRRAAACGLCREKPSLRVPSGTGPPARGGVGPSGPVGRS